MTTHHESSLQINEEDKFFSRLLSKEKTSSSISITNNNNNNNMNSSSFRVYYGSGSGGAIPFMWESTPGTPKHKFSDTSHLPPLTPPPSFRHHHHHHHAFNQQPKQHYSSSRHNLLHIIFLRLSRKKKTTYVSPLSSSPSYSSSSCTSSSSSFTSTNSKFRRHGLRCFALRPKSPLHFGFNEKEQQQQHGSFGSPTSTLCGGFGGGGKSQHYTCNNGFRGCFQWKM